MGNSRINFFYSTGRCYGALLRIHGRMHVLGICTRGIFWRIGGRVFQPIAGYWESMFRLHHSIRVGNQPGTGINLLLTMVMRDEKIIIRVRPGGIRGAIHFHRTGFLSIKLAYLDTEIFNPLDNLDYQAFSSNQLEDIRGHENIEKWY